MVSQGFTSPDYKIRGIDLPGTAAPLVGFTTNSIYVTNSGSVTTEEGRKEVLSGRLYLLILIGLAHLEPRQSIYLRSFLLSPQLYILMAGPISS